MTKLPPNPYGNSCEVTLELPWELAEALVKYAPSIIRSISTALEHRKADAHQKPVVKALLVKECEDNKAEWARLALYCEDEIARRSNAPGQRPQIIRQLAAELKVSRTFLTSICRVFKSEAKAENFEQRQAAMVRLHFGGWSNRQIADELKVSVSTVERTLNNEKDLLSVLKASLPDYQKLKSAAATSAGARP